MTSFILKLGLTLFKKHLAALLPIERLLLATKWEITFSMVDSPMNVKKPTPLPLLLTLPNERNKRRRFVTPEDEVNWNGGGEALKYKVLK